MMRSIVRRMLEAFGDTQKNILSALRDRKDGLTADQLADHVSVTRTAIRQHMQALEQLGYTQQASQRETGGRPAILYKLSDKGFDLFPKQYGWFSELMLQSLRNAGGSAALEERMRDMGRAVALSLAPSLVGKSEAEKVEAVVAVMNQLAYEAKLVPMADSQAGRGIEATNCVYHALASKFPEVCELDRELLRGLLGEVDHQTCMVRGGASCRFAFPKAKS